jgi:hypothetical protein
MPFRPLQAGRELFQEIPFLRDCDALLGRSIRHPSLVAEPEILTPSEDRLDHRYYRHRAFIDRGHDVRSFVPGAAHEVGPDGVRALPRTRKLRN